jgi:DNA topoisomerase-1
LEEALDLLSLPKNLGQHPERKKDVKVGIGRFGPYVVCDGDFRSIPKGENFLKVTFARALELLSQPKKGRGSSQVLKELGVHPSSGESIQVVNGPYGPYLKMGKKNQSLPEGITPEEMTLEKAVELMGTSAVKNSRSDSKNKKSKVSKAVTSQQKSKGKTKTVEPVKTPAKVVKKSGAAGSKKAKAKPPIKKK